MPEGLTAFLFPGQGAQAVGMGADVHAASPAARAVFDEADALFGFSLSKVILDGPASELLRSDHAQPALLCVSIAMLRAMEERLGRRMPQASFFAGHSLGEYTALVASGALDLTAALRLVRLRGELMQVAAEATSSGMAALLGMKLDGALAACEGTGAQVANVNSVEQIVIAGPDDALQRAIARAKEAGARRAIPLEVAGAFHTEVMRPAQQGMDRALAEVPLTRPSVPVIANTSGRPLMTEDDIRHELATQLCGCVYWQQSIEYMAEQGVTRFVEIGPGKVLSGLAKRIAPGTEATSVGDLDALNALT
ncbi:MAG: ACP S-malonyltransferase [Dehalococcoidia bacterium]